MRYMLVLWSQNFVDVLVDFCCMDYKLKFLGLEHSSVKVHECSNILNFSKLATDYCIGTWVSLKVDALELFS